MQLQLPPLLRLLRQLPLLVLRDNPAPRPRLQVADYAVMQRNIIRPYSPHRFITHNFMGFFLEFDHWRYPLASFLRPSELLRSGTCQRILYSGWSRPVLVAAQPQPQAWDQATPQHDDLATSQPWKPDWDQDAAHPLNLQPSRAADSHSVWGNGSSLPPSFALVACTCACDIQMYSKYLSPWCVAQ